MSAQSAFGIDIGSNRIRVTAVQSPSEKGAAASVLGIGIAPSSGVRKGAVTDVQEILGSITAALEEAERMSGEPIHHAFISVGGAHLMSFESRGVVAVGHGGEITQDDVDRAVEASQAISIPQNRQIIRTIQKSFTVDNEPNIKNPVGLKGVRLEVITHIVTGLLPALKNLEGAVHGSGVDIDDLVPAPLAAAESALDKRQKDLGVLILDIGAGTTGMAVYEEGVVVTTATLPVGGESVTSDIAIGLRTSVDTAEKLKIEYGTVAFRELSDRDTIDLSALSRSDVQVVSKRQLGEIIEARYSEIFEMVNRELKAIDRDGQLPAGAVLVGGGAKIPGILDLARDTLKLPVAIGFPKQMAGMADRAMDPAFCVSVGLAMLALRGPSRKYGMSSEHFTSLFASAKNFFKKILP